jgi:hypothetical protein
MKIKWLLTVILLVCAFSVQALNDQQILDNTNSYDRVFYQNRNMETPAGENSFQIIEGSGKVLLTAPHTINHVREGNTKLREVCTGSYAQMLHELTDVPIIYMNYKDLDSNYYDNTDFKAALGKYLDNHPEIEVVFDLHGASSSRPFAVDLGTMNGKSLQNQWLLPYVMKWQFKKENIKDVSFNYFSAAYQNTVTKFVAKKGISAIQIEINREYRCSDDEKTLQFIRSMEKIIEMNN